MGQVIKAALVCTRIAYVDYDKGEDYPNTVRLLLNKDLGKASERRGHHITVENYVIIEGYDEPGIVQALYYCEDVMNMVSEDPAEKGQLLTDMIVILKNEKQNAMDTIPLVEFDSVLGFEPSMEYVTDRIQ